MTLCDPSTRARAVVASERCRYIQSVHTEQGGRGTHFVIRMHTLANGSAFRVMALLLRIARVVVRLARGACAWLLLGKDWILRRVHGLDAMRMADPDA